MSANLPLTWIDKKNSPELEAFLKQYGDQYYMTAEQINQLRDAVNEMAVIQQSTFLGAAEPTFTPAGTGRAYWIAVKPGTYANHGGVVVGANEIAFIIRDVAGAFSVSKTGLDLTGYLKPTDVLNKADLVVGKNLFNKTTTTDGFYLSNANVATASANFCYTDFIPVLPSSNYKSTTSIRFTTYFDINKNYVGGGNSTATTSVISIPAGVYFIRFTLEGLALKNTCQFELGSLSTAYEAYKLSINPNQVSDYAKTSDLPSVVTPLIAQKADLALGKNLFNKATTTDNFYMASNGSTAALAGHCYSDFIPVVAGSQYFISGNSARFLTFFNSSKVNVAGGSDSAISTFTAPAGVAFVRITLTSLAQKNTCQFELGNAATTYETYSLSVPKSQLPANSSYNNKIACPLKQHFLTTIENNIYLDEFQRRVLPNFILDTTPYVGSRKNDIIRATNPTAGNYSILNALVDLDYIDVMRKNYTAVVTDLSKTTAINVLSIGDSYTDIGQYVKKMGQTIPNVNHVGMCKAATGTDVKREGRSGWTLAQYMTQTGSTAGTGFFSPFLHPVAPYTYYGHTGFWQKVFVGTAPGYEIATFVPWVTTLNINASGVRSTPNVNDVMYFTVDSAYKYWDGSAWTVISAATLGFTFNFAKYLTTWSIPTPDVVTVLLGMNDFRTVALASFDSFFVGWKSNLDAFIASVKAANANVKVIIATCNSTEYNDLSGKANAAIWEGYNSVITAYDNREGEKIFISDTKVSVDRVLGFSGTRAIPFSNYTGAETIWLTQGDVHLNTGGMNQIGEKLAATIQYAR